MGIEPFVLGTFSVEIVKFAPKNARFFRAKKTSEVPKIGSSNKFLSSERVLYGCKAAFYRPD